MKKIIAINLSLLLITLFLAACGEGATEPENSSTAITESSLAASSGNDLLDETSTPEGYVSQPDNNSSDESSNSDSEESGNNDESSKPDSENNGQSSTFDGKLFVKDSSSYSVVYTKVSPLNAKEAFTHRSNKITAIYDGSVTRFFDAVNGTYYYAVSGKALYPCCRGGFLPGDKDSFSYEYQVIFERAKDNENEVEAYIGEHFGHGFGTSEVYYSTTDKTVYSFYHDENGLTVFSYSGNGSTVCREYKGVLDGVSEPDQALVGKYGVIDGNEIVIPFEYDYIDTYQTEYDYIESHPNESEVGVYLAIKDGRSYYISSNGTVLTPDGFDCGSQPINNRAWVFEDGQGYIIEFK